MESFFVILSKEGTGRHKNGVSSANLAQAIIHRTALLPVYLRTIFEWSQTIKSGLF